LSLLPALIAVLLFTHEFRYNIAAHTLTLSNSRNKVLAAKIIVVSIIALVAASVVGILSPLLSIAGINANHLHLVHQSYYFWGIAWRGLVYGWGYAILALLIATLVRDQIGAIITLLIFPDLVEGLLSIWLKGNIVYLPFSALHSMLGAGFNSGRSNLSPVHSMYVILIYLVVGWAVAWYLFLKRDAA
ncbi:MAG: hypothetical protein ACREF7_02360, partial [Candidatus Saccharimonadales bacterium]